MVRVSSYIPTSREPPIASPGEAARIDIGRRRNHSDTRRNGRPKPKRPPDEGLEAADKAPLQAQHPDRGQAPAQATPRPPMQIVWRNVVLFAYLHVGALYAILLYQLSAVAITAGAHRLWCHRSYKAKWPLRLFLMVIDTLAFQNHIYEWVRDHRVHHKYSETDADPHNASRGFFFSHVGWLLVRKHPDILSYLDAPNMLHYSNNYSCVHVE
ncbi:Acyl-CoA Delta(11) desaturase [Gryllus bimaculatus]|nr:Acyl-CoA Delta(11) desaturase [Gryllus bimaculatus]